MYATRSVTKRTDNMADEPAVPIQQQGGDEEEARASCDNVLQRYDGTSTWEVYLTQFEITAELNGWTAPKKVAFLATSLHGSATNILGAIPADRHKDYSALITAPETRFACSVQKELNRVRLRNRRR